MLGTIVVVACGTTVLLQNLQELLYKTGDLCLKVLLLLLLISPILEYVIIADWTHDLSIWLK